MKLELLRFSLGNQGEPLFPDRFQFVEVDADHPCAVLINKRTWGLAFASTRNADFEKMDRSLRFFAWEWDRLPQNVVSADQWVRAAKQKGVELVEQEVIEKLDESLSGSAGIFNAFVAIWANGSESYERQIREHGSKDQWEDFSKIKIERVKRDGNKSEGSD